MASSSSTPAASSSHSRNYEVFLSFRGEDTRKTFVDHLYTALVQRGIYTYKDDETLARGELLRPALMKAIRESRISVIVFSENYADSAWCLDELEYIMICRDETGQIVIPIFYHVDPSEVRKQNGRYGEAFAKHELTNYNKVGSWRRALVAAGSLSGWVPEDVANGHESKFIKEIVEAISNKLFPLTSTVDENLVGLRTRSQILISKLEIWSGGVRMVGIWGVGGGGKTTLATSVYDEICSKFEGCCFVENIREQSNTNGLEQLQVKILSGVLKQEKVSIERVHEGRQLIKSRLCNKKVLIVLDDVDDLDQLEALAGSYDWFGEGSRIIITTRDEHLLKTHQVNVIHIISLLDDKEALELFCKHAPQNNMLIEDYKQLTKDVVFYACGLPLALKVLGCFLCDKDTNEWRSALARLKAIPNTNIFEKLKISYNGLTLEEKTLFLDIACFFRRFYIYNVIDIFEACGYYPVIGIKVLTEKTLITVTKYGRLDMHDLVQEMALYIVTGEHPDNPEKHSRVWDDGHIRKLCAMPKATALDNIEAIIVFPTKYNPLPHNQRHVVANMKKLRWIDWTSIPGRSFPRNFPSEELRCLRLRYSQQRYLWKDSKQYLPNLKMVKLHYLEKLIKTPDLSGLPNLERFELSQCWALQKIHPSIGDLQRLVHLIVYQCRNLKKVPPLTQSHKLQTFEISECVKVSKVKKIQEQINKIGVLKHANLRKSGKEVASCKKDISISICSGFNLHAKSCLKFPSLPCDNIFNLTDLRVFHRDLRKLTLDFCNLKDGDIESVGLWNFPNIVELDLSYNKFSSLQLSALKLPRLKYLNVSSCYRLVELSGLPSSIAVLIAQDCPSLETIGDISNCKWLWKVSLVTQVSSLRGEDRILLQLLQGNAVEHHFISFRPRSIHAIPKRLVDNAVENHFINFRPRSIDRLALFKGEIRLQLPRNWFNHFSGFLMCIATTDSYPDVTISMKLEIDEEYSQVMVWDDSPKPDYKHTYIGYVSFNSLMRNSTSLNSAYNTISLSIKNKNKLCGFVGDLVTMKSNGNDTAQTTKIPKDSSEFYDMEDRYGKKTFMIQHHSNSSINIVWSPLLWSDKDRHIVRQLR